MNWADVKSCWSDEVVNRGVHDQAEFAVLSASTERCDGARRCKDFALCLFDCRIRGLARRCDQGRVGEDLSEVFFG